MNTKKTHPRNGYFVFCRHSYCVVLPGRSVAEALPRGHGGVSHSGRGDQNAQVLNGTPQTVSLRLRRQKDRIITPLGDRWQRTMSSAAT